MRSILSPLPGSSGGGSSGGGSSSIAGPRLRVHLHPRSKRKGKGKSKFSPEAWTPKSKGTHTFQKKFVLVDYMGLDVPRRFALKESFVLMRGILPEIEVSAEESVVRNSVTEAIKHCERTLASLGPAGFEFLEASGKCLCIPAHNPGLKWTGRAVKELAGTGAVYVRLTEEREEEEDSCSDSSSSTLPDVKLVKVETPGK